MPSVSPHVHGKPVELSEPEHLIEVLASGFQDGVVGGADWQRSGHSCRRGRRRPALVSGSAALGSRRRLDRFTALRSSLRSSANCPARTRWQPKLDLDTEIRFHLTPRVHEFVGECWMACPSKS